MIVYRIDRASGVPAYVQLVDQTKRALRLGHLRVGDQLPTAKEVVGDLAINPNTVLKAYKELESAGLVHLRAGVGTFVTRTLATAAPAATARVRAHLADAVRAAADAGLDREDVEALLADCLDQHHRSTVTTPGGGNP